MNYCNIKSRDIANGVGVREVLFVSGCTHHCKGCFQPETWDFNYGEPFSDDIQASLIERLKPSFIDGLTVLGGEPFEPENQRGLIPFLKKVKEVLPSKSIWVYSGYTWEQLTGQEESRCRCEATDEMLSLIDILVDGEFIQNLHDISLRFKGSSNQRIIDVQKSIGRDIPALSPLNEKR